MGQGGDQSVERLIDLDNHEHYGVLHTLVYDLDEREKYNRTV